MNEPQGARSQMALNEQKPPHGLCTIPIINYWPPYTVGFYHSRQLQSPSTVCCFEHDKGHVFGDFGTIIDCSVVYRSWQVNV